MRCCLFLREIVQNTDLTVRSAVYRKLSNQIKNRYSDVLCLDHSRVQLCKLDGDDEVIIYCNISHFQSCPFFVYLFRRHACSIRLNIDNDCL